jgi:hypothetical protein
MLEDFSSVAAPSAALYGKSGKGGGRGRGGGNRRKGEEKIREGLERD